MSRICNARLLINRLPPFLLVNRAGAAIIDKEGSRAGEGGREGGRRCSGKTRTAAVGPSVGRSGRPWRLRSAAQLELLSRYLSLTPQQEAILC